MFKSVLAATAAPVALLLAAATSAGATGHLTTLHSFCQQASCLDGSFPAASPVADSAGNLYAVTRNGGTNGRGTVYKATFTAGHWVVTRIHNFCSAATCADGADPQSSLVIDTTGHLYGTSSAGGNAGTAGVIYELTPSGGSFTYKILHRFCALASCADGTHPNFAGLSYGGQEAGLPYNGTSALFGTTTSGGANNMGTVYTLVPSGNDWIQTVIHSSCSFAGCSDGGVPQDGVVMNSSGELLGAASMGGAHGSAGHGGTIFKMTQSGGHWTVKVLHAFCTQQADGNCVDGDQPFGPPAFDSDGNLYGSTFLGGAHVYGVVYKLTPDGDKYDYTQLHAFCSRTNCGDGGILLSRITLDSSGNLLGTALSGGDMTASAGTVFQLSGATLKTLTNLVVFRGTNGSMPVGTLVPDGTGAYLGVATTAGAHSGGTLFRVTP
jgi:uncharacterized repeat protein (TIGR03803 family)